MPILNVNLNINEVSRDVKLNPFIAEGGVTASFVSGGLNYISHTFYSSSGTTAPQTFRVLNGEIDAQVLVVGGGAGGRDGGVGGTFGNAGGAGGVLYSSSYHFQINPQGQSTYSIIVGKGGENAVGVFVGPQSSSLTPAYVSEVSPILIAYQGGNAGADTGGNGASGGGGSITSGSAIYGDQGKDGGLSTGGFRGGAGGGGAAQKGFNGDGTPTGADGGDGKAFTLQDGTSKYYGGGGGGGGWMNIGPGPGGVGGLGGGGNGGSGATGAGSPGQEGTGGGGGGGATATDAGQIGNGGKGGSGIVIITYQVP